MKLAEAADILGISLEEVTVDSLKQTYKKLMTSWDNEKIKDSSMKFRFLQINEAYQKLHSVMESKEEPKDDQHELANFMRMVMDIVGISDGGNLPSAAMTFGMMFGGHRHNGDEWSTDDEMDREDNDEDDEDQEEEEDGDDDYDQRSEENDIWPSLVDHADQWEPPAKQYSNMNLKDQVCKARKESELKSELSAMAENERRMKLAKKRAEKRKKQKEQKKLKEQGGQLPSSLSPSTFPFTSSHHSQSSSTSQSKTTTKSPEVIQFENMLAMATSAESIERIVNRQKDQHRHLLLDSIQRGDADTVQRILQFNTMHENIPQSILESVFASWKKEFPSYCLFHRCITDTYYFIPEDLDHSRDHVFDLLPEQVRQLILRKVQIAQLLLSCQEPLIDVNAYDDQGLSILHKSIVVGDMQFAKFVVNIIVTASTSTDSNQTVTERRITINLNTRCRKKGWAPIHYAVERFNIEAIRLLGYSGANLQATSATDKKLTPLELAKGKLKQSNKTAKTSSGSATAASNVSNDVVNEVIAVLQELISWQKALGKDEKKKSAEVSVEPHAEQKPRQEQVKESLPTKTEQPSNTASSNNTSTAVSSSKSSEKKKKKKKGDSNNPTEPKPTPTPATSSAVTVEATTKSNGEEEKHSNTKKEKSKVVVEAPKLPELPLVASRDEIVDRLLAMGFKEADCLSAISLYGTDIDRAISWLCDRPVETPKKETPKPVVLSKATEAPKTREHITHTTATSSSNKTSTHVTPANNSKATPKKKDLLQAPAPSSASKSAIHASHAQPHSQGLSNPLPAVEESKKGQRAWQTKPFEDERRKEGAKRASVEEQRASPSVHLSLSQSLPKTSTSNSSPTLSSGAISGSDVSSLSEGIPVTKAQEHMSDVNTVHQSPRLASMASPSTDLPSLSAQVASTSAAGSSHLIPGYIAVTANQAGVPMNTGLGYPVAPTAPMTGIYYSSPYPAIPAGYAISPAILVPGFAGPVSTPLYSVLPGPMMTTIPPPPNIIHPSQQHLFQQSLSEPAVIDPLMSGYVSGNLMGSIDPAASMTDKDSVEVGESLVSGTEMFGALELSVGAKPFVPKSFAPQTTASTSTTSDFSTVSPLLSSLTSSTPLPGSSDLLSNLTSTSAAPFLFDDLATSSLVGNSAADVWTSGLNTLSATRTISPSSSAGNVVQLGDAFSGLGSSSLGGLGGEIGGLGGYFSSGLFGGLNQPVVGSGIGSALHETFDFDVNRDILPELDSLL
eukprot:gene5834-6273_t